jgi:hypothetical protein
MKYVLDAFVALRWVILDALAEREQCELLATDDKLIRNLQTQFLFIKALSTSP